MDVFLMVRRKKTTIFLDAKESTTVLELKKMIEGITKKSPSEQQLYNKEDAGAGYFYIKGEGEPGGLSSLIDGFCFSDG